MVYFLGLEELDELWRREQGGDVGADVETDEWVSVLFLDLDVLR